MNLFEYVGNGPTDGVDPNGMDPPMNLMGQYESFNPTMSDATETSMAMDPMAQQRGGGGQGQGGQNPQQGGAGQGQGQQQKKSAKEGSARVGFSHITMLDTKVTPRGAYDGGDFIVTSYFTWEGSPPGDFEIYLWPIGLPNGNTANAKAALAKPKIDYEEDEETGVPWQMGGGSIKLVLPANYVGGPYSYLIEVRPTTTAGGNYYAGNSVVSTFMSVEVWPKATPPK